MCGLKWFDVLCRLPAVLQSRIGTVPLVSLINEWHGEPLQHLGAAAVALANRSDLQVLKDVKDQRVSSHYLSAETARCGVHAVLHMLMQEHTLGKLYMQHIYAAWLNSLCPELLRCESKLSTRATRQAVSVSGLQICVQTYCSLECDWCYAPK